MGWEFGQDRRKGKKQTEGSREKSCGCSHEQDGRIMCRSQVPVYLFLQKMFF